MAEAAARPRTILTAQEDQQQILCDISHLYLNDEPFEVDLTYGSGSFWSGVAEPLKPAIRVDYEPRWLTSKDDPKAEFTEVNVQADVRKLPFRDHAFSSVVFDPPFIHAAGKDSIMGQRFGSYPSQISLRRMYWAATMELYRIVAPGGLVVWKCQDIVESGKQNWNHVDIQMNSHTAGFTAVDLFILVRKAVPQGHNHANQKHARRVHSYFWCFRKEGKLHGGPGPV